MERGLAAGSLAKMGIFLLLLIFSPVRGDLEGICPRKDPPAGVLVLSPGSKLVLTCGGRVEVDGVELSLTGSSAGINKRESSSNVPPTTQKDIHNSTASVHNDNSSTNNAVSEPRENMSLIYTDAEYTVSPHIIRPPRTTRSLKDELNWTTEEMDVEGNYEEDGEGKGASRVTRGIKLRPEWKWNTMTVIGGGITFERSGFTISLPPLRPTDSGKYTCHHRGKEKFGVKVFVAESPESPKVFCYKKTPSSKIRCEWTLQKTFKNQPSCYLLLNKSPKEKFIQKPCSYSIKKSRCWCVLDHNDDDRFTFYSVYMCFTSITANATSPLIRFKPLDTLKPEPPSNVSVRQEEGRERRLTVFWNLPESWKPQDHYFKLIYEVKYNPVKPSISKEQVIPVRGRRHEKITDIMPGVEYLIQVRTKDEFEGQWSDWSAPVYARSWTKHLRAPSIVSVVEDEGQETMTVIWSLPAILEEQNNFNFVYEIKYCPVNVFLPEKVRQFEGGCSYTIVDAMPGAEYLIQLRFKKEHAGQWSDWSTPFNSKNIIDAAIFPEEGSGVDNGSDNPNSTLPSSRNDEWVYHVLWIFGLFMLLSIILAINICRHGDRLISKFYNLYFTTYCGESSRPSPSVPAAPEGMALDPTKRNKEHPPSDEKESEENEEREILKEKMELMHFDNRSYFIL